jgi:hypothetical protein
MAVGGRRASADGGQDSAFHDHGVQVVDENKEFKYVLPSLAIAVSYHLSGDLILITAVVRTSRST